MSLFNTEKYLEAIRSSQPIQMNGRITQIIGLLLESQGPLVELGELCTIHPRSVAAPVPAEVVGFRHDRVLLMPLGEMQGIGPGCEVRATHKMCCTKVGDQLLGRIIDGLGNPLRWERSYCW